MALIRSKGSLLTVANTLTLRCDAKQVEPRFLELDALLRQNPTNRLNDYLPEPFVKGKQPSYIEDPQDSEYAFVVSTLAVQPLQINATNCRFTSLEFYKSAGSTRQLKDGDVVLTMDGGTSIGKAAVFDKAKFAAALDMDPEDVYATVDSHVAILRPRGISPLALAYLLASPIGQLQFQRAESGASGQTAVSEDDVRYFRFPKFSPTALEAAVASLQNALTAANEQVRAAEAQQKAAWAKFETSLG